MKECETLVSRGKTINMLPLRRSMQPPTGQWYQMFIFLTLSHIPISQTSKR